MKEKLKTLKVNEPLHRMVKMYCAEKENNMIDFVEQALLKALPSSYIVKKKKK